VEFAGMDEGVDRADDTVCPLRFVACEVGQLPEDDIDPDSADEPTITAFDTNRRTEPSRRNPAASITTPVSTDRVNNALAGSSRREPPGHQR
jgi:hypothetical protein